MERGTPMEKTIAMLGGDRRMALLARLLAEDGHPVRTWGLAAFGMEDTALEEAAQVDRVVLPVPLSRGKNLNCTAAALPLCGLFALLRPEQRLYAGGVKAADREAAAEFGLTLTDYLSREELAVRTSAGRLLLVHSTQISEKTTRDSAGVSVITLKKNQTIESVKPASSMELANPHRYRVRTLPAAGALLREEDLAEQLQLTF